MSAHSAIAPGTVTGPQPVVGMAEAPENDAGSSAAPDRPLPFTPCSRLPSHTIANASPPRPLVVGSNTVSAAAVAIAASTALPPARSVSSPACAARG